MWSIIPQPYCHGSQRRLHMVQVNANFLYFLVQFFTCVFFVIFVFVGALFYYINFQYHHWNIYFSTPNYIFFMLIFESIINLLSNDKFPRQSPRIRVMPRYSFKLPFDPTRVVTTHACARLTLSTCTSTCFCSILQLHMILYKPTNSFRRNFTIS